MEKVKLNSKVRPTLWIPPPRVWYGSESIVELHAQSLFMVFLIMLGDLRRFRPHRHSPAACAARDRVRTLDPLK